jgi:hypothetical protein
MGDFAALKARIADELERTDMTARIEKAIPRAIEFHADRRFWFLDGDGTVNTVAGQDYVAVPTGLRTAHDCEVEILVGQNSYEMRKMGWRDYRRHAQYATSRGQPFDYAFRDGRFYLHPVPDAVYQITAYGIYDQPVLTSGTDENAWTDQGQDLIVAEVCLRIARDFLRDDERMRNAASARNEALQSLRGQSAARKGTRRIRGHL